MIVVTGASGLLGSTIIDALVSNNISVTGLYHQTQPRSKAGVTWQQVDVTDILALTEIFNGAECVIHAAAMISFNQRNREKMFKTNVEGTANVVTACLQSGVKRLVHVSSVAALEKKPTDTVIDEKNQWTGTGHSSNYGQTKHLAELEVLRGEAEGLSIAMVNPSVILSRDNTYRSSGQILQYINDERPFYTDGSVNYIDARDVAEMVFRLSQNLNFKGRFIANTATISWKILFKEVAERLGKKPPYIKVTATLTRWVAAAEWIRCAVLGREPLVTKETAALARQNVFYSNEKVIKELGMKFRSLEETLDWCCKSQKAGAGSQFKTNS